MSYLLAPLSLLWWLVVRVRGWLFDVGLLRSRRFDVPVICVGNLAVGGTGKTPHVELLLRLLHREGWRVAMLSRGYGRHSRGWQLATPSSTAAEIGDEPFQVLHNCPFATVAVCERRVEGIERLLALPEPPQVIVLDDAYQHRYVIPGFSVLLTDAHRLYTRDYLLPWGRLREPASAARRAQVIVVTKCTDGQRPALSVRPDQQLFYSHIVYRQPYRLTDGCVLPSGFADAGCGLLIAAIANPAPIVARLHQWGVTDLVVRSFRDHHAFTAADAASLNRAFESLPPGALAYTTQKDAPRLQAVWSLLSPALRQRLAVLPIEVAVEPALTTQPSFNQTIQRYVNANQRNRRVD